MIGKQSKKKTKSKRRKKKILSAEERKQKEAKENHRKIIRSSFTFGGFKRIPSVSDKQFTFEGTQGDFDDAFLYENILVIVEYTTSQESDVSGHLKKKKILFDKINKSPARFVEFLKETFPTFEENTKDLYEPDHYRVRLLYCSLNRLKPITKDEVPDIGYLDYNVARYFESVSKTIRKSARFEIFSFLKLKVEDIGEAAVKPPTEISDTYSGSVLPEAHSNLGTGFKVVSFYIDPGAILERAYVLRRQGWKSGLAVYQRMISKKKIETVRKHLLDNKRVFVNNIIVTLPDRTKLIDTDDNTITFSSVRTTQPAIIRLPKQFNSVGIIDGQHRVFSYHEGSTHEDEIQKLRIKQNLLVTGIIFPRGMSPEDRLKFEAELFLEINSTQSSAKSDLKQEIGLMLKPFSMDSIAKSVVNHLNDDNGALTNEFERYFYDKDKLKTTTVVSYGVRPLVNYSSDDSLFSVWKNPNKHKIKDENKAILAEYILFCAEQINHFIAAAKFQIPNELWTADKKVKRRFLTTTNINGLISCLRLVAKEGKLLTVPKYIEAMHGLDKFNFSSYKSSQYNRMGLSLYEKFFIK